MFDQQLASAIERAKGDWKANVANLPRQDGMAGEAATASARMASTAETNAGVATTITAAVDKAADGSRTTERRADARRTGRP